MSQPPVSTSLDTEISFAEIGARARRLAYAIGRRKRLIIVPTLLMLALGAFVAFGSTEEYTAGAKLLPYRGTGASPSGLAGLAGLAGVRVPGGLPGEGVIPADIYPEVIRTLDFQITLAETPIQFGSVAGKITPANYFSDRYRPSALELLGNYTLGLPSTVLESIRSRPEPATVRREAGATAFREINRSYEKQVRKIGERIGISIDKRTGVVSLTATMPEAIAAASLAKTTADLLTKTVIEFDVRKANEQLVFIERQLGQARARYHEAQRRLAAFADANRVLVSATAQIERQRLEREATFAFETYDRMTREREQAVVKQSQDTPVFALLETPIVPTARSSPKRAKVLLAFLVLGLIAGLLRVSFRVDRSEYAG